jgi:inositol polyphosphate 5-phosphatase INPP5B/F
LEDILILRVADGRDHFIPIKGSWLPSCFGRSIEELIRVPDGGIRVFATPRLRSGAGAIPYDLDVHVSAPKELFKLTDAVIVLIERVLAEEQMLEDCDVPRDVAGWPFDKDSWKWHDKKARMEMKLALIEALDSDRPLLEALAIETPAVRRIEVVSEVLLLFLRALTDGVITAPLWAKLEASLPSLGSASRTPESYEDDKASVLDILSVAPNHNIAFVFLTTTLARVGAELAPITKADASSLPAVRRALPFRRSVGTTAAEAAIARRRARERRFAEIFGRVVCRAPVPTKEKERRTMEERQRNLIELFVHRDMDG